VANNVSARNVTQSCSFAKCIVEKNNYFVNGLYSDFV